jgi:ribulose-bisphosphate carboxylase small chain
MTVYTRCEKNQIITQGQFSYLPELSLSQIEAQISYAISQKYALSIEYTEDPHPRNSYWEMWGFPQFDLDKADVSLVVSEMESCMEANPNCYIKILAFDNSEGVESTVMSFIVNRPKEEADYELLRTEGVGRNQIYSFRKRTDEWFITFGS